MAFVETREQPTPIRACWLAWIAVQTPDQGALIAALGVSDVREIGWAEGVDLIDEVAHSGGERFSTIVITPPVDGWTLIIGPWCGLSYLRQTVHVTALCQQLSVRFTKAQAYFHSEQNDGEAWLITEHGHVVRRWISDHPELSLGEPVGVERRLLDAFGITGKPEDLDPDDDLASSWGATWGDCWATTVAAESSLDPTEIGPASQVSGRMLVATAPAFGPLDPHT